MQSADLSPRIGRLSARLRWAVLALAAAQPAIVLAALATMSDPEILRATLGHAAPGAEIGAALRLAVTALALVPALILSLGLWSLAPPLAAMAAGRTFTAAAERGLRRLALAIIAATLAKLLTTPAIGLLLTLGADERSLILSLSFVDLQAVILGAALWLMAWVMSEGRALASENASFV